MEPLFPLQIPSQFKVVYFKSITSDFICYIIYCNKTRKWYIGSGISGRVWHHFLKSKHHNDKLYKDFIEFGPEAFSFWISDCESKEDSLFQEQILLDFLPKVSSGAICHQEYCYNISTNAMGGDTGQSKPFELRNAITHEVIASFSSTYDKTISIHLETYKTQPQISDYLKDGPDRGEMLCFWNFGVVSYVCYKNETIKELENRTGRCFEKDRANKLRFIPEVTVTNGVETRHLSGYKNYYEAARMLGLPETQWGNFGKMIQGKRSSCDGWRLVV